MSISLMHLRRGALFAFTTILLLRSASGVETRSPIAGLWFGERQLPVIVQGDLTIELDRRLRAIVSGFDVPNAPKMDEPFSIFDFPNGGGYLLVTFKGKSPDKLTAFYNQPANDINHNAYVTPVTLSRSGLKNWRGRIDPLQPKLSFYLSIQQQADGTLNAVIRNPELNLFRRDNYRVEIQGSAVTFSSPEKPEKKFKGELDQKGKVLTAQLPNLPGPIQLNQVKTEQALGLIARIPRTARYVYEKPKHEEDGWAIASLKDVELDPKPLTELIDKIIGSDPTSNPLPIHSLLIARHGKLVLDEYFYGSNRDQPHTMRSASKTFGPLLVGIARDENAPLMQPESPVYAQFGGYERFANPDPRKAKITVRDLMTMTSGLACDDSDENAPGNEDVMQQQEAQPDWYKYTLDLPMARDPGGDQAVYCSAGINLLGDIVARQALGGQGLPEFFEEKVARPLQIKIFHWNLMPTGEGYLGGGLYLRPRDQLKLGQLYLNGGTWNGRRVISKEWVERSTSRESTFGKTLGSDHDYGYGWHLYHFEVGGRSYRAYAAGGKGGQIVMVIPDLVLVVGFTGGAYGEFPKWYKWQTELVPQFIIPAAISTTPH